MWTKGKWEVYEGIPNQIWYKSEMFIASTKGTRETSEANARRIVQCVNGWDDLVAERDDIQEKLRAEGYRFREQKQINKEIVAQRDKLLDIIRKCETAFVNRDDYEMGNCQCLCTAAIAACEE